MRDRRLTCAAVALALLSALAAVAPSVASAAGWLEPLVLSDPARDSINPSVAMDDAGGTVAIWEHKNAPNTNYDLQESVRAAGGLFGPPLELASHSVSPAPEVETTPGGEAVAVWVRFEQAAGVNVIQAATRPPGGAFSPPVDVYAAPAGVIPQGLDLALGPTGTVAAVWTTVDPESGLNKILCPPAKPGDPELPCPNPRFVEASVRRPGAGFSEPARISPPRGPGLTLEEEQAEARKSAAEPSVAVDGDGEALASWELAEPEGSVIQAAAMESAAKSFSPPVKVSAAGGDSVDPLVGIGEGGATVAVWSNLDEGAQTIRAAVRSGAGASFSELGQISPSPAIASNPALAMAPGGAATVAWHATNAVGPFIQTATRLPGGTFSTPVSLSSGKDLPDAPTVAMNAAGDAVIAWPAENEGQRALIASTRRGFGGFSPPVVAAMAGSQVVAPDLALDALGDAVAVFQRLDGAKTAIGEVGYDASPPQLRDFSVPARATVGEPVPISASAFDTWAVGPPSFEFGDGAEANGAAVSHVYGSPGTFTVRVRVVDSTGASASATRAIAVKARNEFSVERFARNRAKGTGTLFVRVPEPGAFTLAGKGIHRASLTARTGGLLAVPVRAVGRSLKRLRHRGKLKARLDLLYAPVGGDPRSAAYAVTLAKKHG